MAGLIFAHEAILRHYSHKSILAIATASGISYAVSTAIWGDANNCCIAGSIQFIVNFIISFLAGPIFGYCYFVYEKFVIF